MAISHHTLFNSWVLPLSSVAGSCTENLFCSLDYDLFNWFYRVAIADDYVPVLSTSYIPKASACIISGMNRFPFPWEGRRKDRSINN